MRTSNLTLALAIAVLGTFLVHVAAASTHNDDEDGNEAQLPLYTCEAPAEGETRNEWHWRGTNLGGWLVLEPWITPSLFYQFLGASDRYPDSAPAHVAIDSYTFCTALGPKEANRQLRKHWRNWVTEEHIENLAAIGVDTLRIPVADWMYVPYAPFLPAEGGEGDGVSCWDGAMEALEQTLGWCAAHGVGAVLDVHTMQGSQNPFDNSGHADHVKWVSNTAYLHQSSADWWGQYNASDNTYLTHNETHVRHGLKVLHAILAKHSKHPAVVGVEPVNEPWGATPLDELKSFYWEVYNAVQAAAPHWVTLLHDSFRLSSDAWGGFLQHCPNFAMDTHIYQAWSDVRSPLIYQSTACNNALTIRRLERSGLPVVVGEWSLATDNCAMWLNGFNDNLPGFPKKECRRFTCPASYMQDEDEQERDRYNITTWMRREEAHHGSNVLLGSTQAPDSTGNSTSDHAPYHATETDSADDDGAEASLGNLPADVLTNPKYSKEHQPVGPFGVVATTQGTGNLSFIVDDQCLSDAQFSPVVAVEDRIMNALALAMLYGYDAGHGQFFWNFRTELEDKWDFQQAVARGWLPMYRGNEEKLFSLDTGLVSNACTVENQLPDVNISQFEAEAAAALAAGSDSTSHGDVGASRDDSSGSESTHDSESDDVAVSASHAESESTPIAGAEVGESDAETEPAAVSASASESESSASADAEADSASETHSSQPPEEAVDIRGNTGTAQDSEKTVDSASSDSDSISTTAPGVSTVRLVYYAIMGAFFLGVTWMVLRRKCCGDRLGSDRGTLIGMGMGSGNTNSGKFSSYSHQYESIPEGDVEMA